MPPVARAEYTPPVNSIERFIVQLGGGFASVVALARWLFEFRPLQFELLNTWPGALGLAALLAGLAARLFNRFAWPAQAALALYLPLRALFAPDTNLQIGRA